MKNYSAFLNEYNGRFAILYADFNVINYLYSAKLELNHQHIILYPDSTAVHLVLKWFNKTSFKKLVSTDMLYNYLNEINTQARKIFLFGNTNEVLENTINSLSKSYEHIIVSGYHSGYNFISTEVIEKINASNCDILLVGLGVGKQEKWILDNFEKINCKLILSCGGWFQFLSGSKRRAPLIIRSLYMEWLYKLVTQFPRVWKRYLIGAPLFVYRILTKKVILTFV